MKHLGDITKISGYDAPVVDCLVGGSPCQDLSVAGKRAGLEGERSGLYIEQVRIVKEMREQDERNGRTGVDVRPRYMVWENVPGAFSSNKGEDFRIVLEELAKVKDKDAVIPMPDKWTNHGCIMGDGWSIAWRVLDAQFWGVPQRRRRIALVADFGGQSAPEILFVRKGVSGDIEPSKPKGKATPTDAQGGFRANDSLGVDVFNAALTGDKAISLVASGNNSTGYSPKVMTPVTFEPGIASREGGRIYEGVSGTLRANAGDNQMATAYGISSYNSNAMKSDNPHSGIYEADTSRTLDGNGGNPSCNQGGIAIVEAVLSASATDYILDDQGGSRISVRDDGKSPTLRTEMHGHPPCVMGSVPYTLKIRSGCEGGGKGALVQEDKSATLATNNDRYLFAPVYSVENHPADSRVNIDESGKVQTFTSRMGTGGGNVPMVMEPFGVETVALEGNGQRPSHKGDGYAVTDKSYTLNTTEVHGVVYALDRASFNQGKNAQFDFEISDKGVNSPIVAKGPSAVCYGINGDKAGTLDSSYYKGCGMRSGVEREVVAVDCRNASEDEVNGALQSNSAHSLNGNNVVRTRYIVRRLTPLECERLQGYPDGWTDIGDWVDSNGKKRQTSDAARYKALGNSIALPPWKWVLKRLCACYERDATMASLFDGIGGFPYLWEQLNGKGTCLWASEIEEFPMAVTKVRIGE